MQDRTLLHFAALGHFPFHDLTGFHGKSQFGHGYIGGHSLISISKKYYKIPVGILYNLSVAPAAALTRQQALIINPAGP